MIEEKKTFINADLIYKQWNIFWFSEMIIDKKKTQSTQAWEQVKQKIGFNEIGDYE